MICGRRKLKDGFGKTQFKWSNGAPTCLACAEAARAEEYEWTSWRTCVACEEEKRRGDFGKKQFKSSSPKCLACAEEARKIDHAIYGQDIAVVLSRCHDERIVELLIKHGKVSKGDILEFLQGETCFCIHREDAGYMDEDWFLVHLETSHNKWELRSALAALVVQKAREAGSPPLTLL